MSSASSAEATVKTGATAGRDAADVPALPDAGTIVIGLGNPLLGDDGIGWRVVEAIRGRGVAVAPIAAATPDGAVGSAVQFDCLAVGGLALMERLVGFRRAILVDALLTGRDAPGTVRRIRLADLPDREASHLDSAHDASLSVALAAGRALGADLPDEIEIVSIEAARVHDFVEELTPAVAAALPEAIATVLAILGDGATAPAAGRPGTA